MSFAILRHFLDDVESLIYAQTHPINVPFVPSSTSPGAVTRPEPLAPPTSGLQDTLAEVAIGLLDWLLDGEISRIEPLFQITPQTWSHVVQTGGVPQATALVTLGLCHAAAAIEPGLAPRVALVDQGSAVPAVFLARLKQLAREVSMGGSRLATAA